ncbi:MAG: tRNA lysidine(34) synthetase TilS, partial [Planctomycetota bacterium]|nr:tRNA lysidine(34) synthetase TilS [Planctomycetota bacterium]
MKLFDSFAQKWAAQPRLGRGVDGRPAVWVIGFSGGLDSVVLLDLCWRYRQEVDDSQIIVAAHLNHGLRGQEAEEDEAFCRRLCAERNIALRVKREDVRRLAACRGIGLEEAGRLARRLFFAEVCAAYEGQPARILLGHHADDQAETILMNILRGAGLRGLAGMSEIARLAKEDEEKIAICRPLLAWRKADLRAYARGRGLTWREDSSNADCAFLRNRLRHEVLPLLERLRPNFALRLLALARAARAASRALSRQGEDLWHACREPRAEGVLLRVDASCPLAVLAEALNCACQRDFGAGRLHAADYDTLARLMADGKGEGQITGGLLLRRTTEGFWLGRPAAPQPPVRCEVSLPTDLPFAIEVLGVRVVAELRPVAAGEAAEAIPAAERADPRIAWLAADRLSWPLLLRTRRSGDRFQPLGAPGARKLKKILCDAKMAQAQRNAVRLLCDQEGIVWLWPWRISHRCRLTAAT